MTAAALLLAPVSALAGEGGHFWSGDWYLKVGAAGFAAPRYEGAKSYLFQVTPMISLGKAGSTVRFSSRNDNPSFALIDNGAFRAGATGKLVMPRDEGDSDDLKGLTPIKLGGELGGLSRGLLRLVERGDFPALVGGELLLRDETSHDGLSLRSFPRRLRRPVRSGLRRPGGGRS